MEHIQFTLIRPILKSLDKSGSYWILSDIKPFFVVTLTGAQSRIPMIHLPLLLATVTRLGELRFPVSHPMIERDFHSSWGGEKVNVVRHEDITPHQPGGRFAPNCTQCFVILAGREPGISILGTNRDEDDCGVQRVDSDTMRGFLSGGQVATPRGLDSPADCRAMREIGSDGASPSRGIAYPADCRAMREIGSDGASPSRRLARPADCRVVRGISSDGASPSRSMNCNSIIGLLGSDFAGNRGQGAAKCWVHLGRVGQPEVAAAGGAAVEDQLGTAR
jgi:hypothetical protein